VSRIRKTLERLRQEGKKALIPYITPEFPFKGVTLSLLRALEKSGADMIEVGIPFSDPLADGSTIQHSSEVALKNGARIPLILDTIQEFRKSSELPLVLMGYINPIIRFGIGEFLKQSALSGVDGLIVPDLPPEEASQLLAESAKHGISNVFLIAPTTPDERIKKIDETSTDFSYCVSVTGTTGARKELGTNGSIEHFLIRVRQNVKKPFVVGFGISNAEQVKKVWQYSDGAVVGSALIDAISQASSEATVPERAAKFMTSLRT